MKFRHLAVAASLAALVASPFIAHAAGLFPNLPKVGGASYCAGNILAGVPGTATVCDSTVPAGPTVLTGNELIPADTALGQGVAPQTVYIPSALLGNYPAAPRNYLDNGALNITQRGTGIITCGTTSAALYGPDRWACNANVTSGAGRIQIVTASPTPPAGYTNVAKVYRTSGALLQPVCAMQEVGTVESTQLAGQTVTFSATMAALAGLVADNAGVANLVVISGTGAGEGLGTQTASPAITPAWTGIATLVNTPVTLTTTFARFSTTVAVPSTVTEVGVMLCFTPTATGAGTTDGFAFTSAQLEVAPSPTAFEFRKYGDDLNRALHYYWQINEPAANKAVGTGNYQTSTICDVTIPTPVQMRAVPTITIGGTAESTSTWAVMVASTTPVALASTYLVADAVVGSTVNQLALQATTAGKTAGYGCTLVGAGGGANIQASADF
jgi:hypothetical protein